MDTKYIFGKNVRDLRLARELSQCELAQEIGIEQSHLSKIEKGEIEPKASTIYEIAENLGVTVDQLFNYDVRESDEDEIDVRLCQLKRRIKGIPVDVGRHLLWIVREIVKLIEKITVC